MAGISLLNGIHSQRTNGVGDGRKNGRSHIQFSLVAECAASPLRVYVLLAGRLGIINQTGRNTLGNSVKNKDFQPLRLASTMRKIIGVKINCIANSILPPGTTMLLGRDMKES